MNIINNLSKEIILYSTIILGGIIFISKRFFIKRKFNKQIYNGKIKKLKMKMKLFFKENTEKIEIKQNITSNMINNQNTNDKYLKMKIFVEKVSNEFHNSIAKNEKQEDSNKNSLAVTVTKKDQIFYYLLNNISDMMVKTNKINNANDVNINTS